MPTNQPRPPFASPPPDAPTPPATVQEPPASLGAQVQRIAAVAGLIFAMPLWGLAALGFANWFGWWFFLAFGIPPLVIMAVGVLLLCLEPLDWFQAFKYKQLDRRQDHYHRGLITQTQVWAIRLYTLSMMRGRAEEPKERIVLVNRWQDAPRSAPERFRTDSGVTQGDEGQVIEGHAVERPTQPFYALPGWSEAMQEVYAIRRKDRTCPLEWAKAHGIKQERWKMAMNGFGERGLLINQGKGRPFIIRDISIPSPTVEAGEGR